jgi:hypothetical protein
MFEICTQEHGVDISIDVAGINDNISDHGLSAQDVYSVYRPVRHLVAFDQPVLFK